MSDRHESRPSRCVVGDCDAVPEEGEDFCAFHDELYGRAVEDLHPGALVPMLDVGGIKRWDGFGNISAADLRPSPEYWSQHDFGLVWGERALLAARARRILWEAELESRETSSRYMALTPLAAPTLTGIVYNPANFSILSSEWTKKGWTPGRMHGRSGQLDRMARMVMSGVSLRAVTRACGCGKPTIQRLHRILETERLRAGLDRILCACGRPSTHRGWCSIRLKQSPKRQATLAALHAWQVGRRRSVA